MRERRQEANNLSGYAAVLLSLIALLAVVAGYGQPPQRDEGIAAQIFQLAIVLLVPTTVVFLATGDWRQPLRTARPLMFSAAALALAFAGLYYLDHYRNPVAGATGRSFSSHEKHGFQRRVPSRQPKQTDGVIEIRLLFRGQWDDRWGARSAVMRVQLGTFVERFVAWLCSQRRFLKSEQAS
jgi:hypothetical protein